MGALAADHAVFDALEICEKGLVLAAPFALVGLTGLGFVR
jgi:hypothetical protein